MRIIGNTNVRYKDIVLVDEMELWPCLKSTYSKTDLYFNF